MGMKSNSNHFKGTTGSKKSNLIKLDIQLFAKLPTNKAQLKHIFRDSEGHLSDNYINRKLLEDLTSDEANYLGEDNFGKKWYSKHISRGQLWASVYNGTISNGGINKKAIDYTPKRGLKVHSIIRRKTK